MTFNKIIIALQHRFETLLRIIVSFFPRNKRLIVYGGTWDLFIDNTKYQFINNNKLMLDYKHVWLTNNPDVLFYMREHHFNVIRSHSIKGIWTILRAGFVVYDDGISYFSFHDLSMGAVRINMWHGIPAKMIGASKRDEEYVFYKQKHWWHKYTLDHKKGDYCISTTEWQKRFYSWSFKIPEDKVVIGGYPRNQVLFMKQGERLDYIKQFESTEFCSLYESIQKERRRKYIYMPTFRDNDKEYLSKAIPNWTYLNEQCSQANVVFYVKVHRAAVLPDLSDYSNIKLLDNKMDVYPMLPLFDRLITDYSGIMFDYSLTRKKVIFYTFDLDDYKSQSRPLYSYYFNLLLDVSVVSNFPQLINSLFISDSEIKDFPVDRFFDKPDDWQVIPSLIKMLS